MLGYAHGRYLVVRMTPLLMLGTMIQRHAEATDSATEDEAKTDDLRQAH
jgi:hypothetical protein